MKLFKYLAVNAIVLITASSFAQVTKLRDLVGVGTNGRNFDDYFSRSVAISNDIIVVGDGHNGYDSAGGNYLSNAGAAYIFGKNQGGIDNWGLVKKITGAGTNGRLVGDLFGVSVAISGDVIVVTAQGNDYDSAGGNYLLNAGAAYIFYKDQGGTNNWGCVKKVTGKGNNGRKAGDYFGTTVAISGDIIVVVDYTNNYDSIGGDSVYHAGAAYIFSKNSGGMDNWGFVKKITGKGINGRKREDLFGNSIAINGDIIVVGAQQQDYDSIGGDSLYLAGAAFIFYKNSGGTDNWGFVKKITGKGVNGRKSFDSFGRSVSINNDIIVVGASNQGYDSAGSNFVSSGAAFIFYKNSGGTDNWG